jgi:hypothetical protein
MTPWFVRNLLTIGSPLPSSAQKAFWLLTYDEIFSYPASQLTPSRWLQSGLISILSVRMEALWTNVQRLIGENGQIFLGPFMLIGMRAFWRRPYARITVIYLLTLLFTMSFIFPFAGSYGGFFHSSTAFMPALWVFTPVGIDRAVKWAAQKRGWNKGEAQTFFGMSAIVLAGVLTMGLFWTRNVGPNLGDTYWESSLKIYQDVGPEILEKDPNPNVIAVNNPPGFYLATGISAIVIPNGSEATLLEVVDRYGVDWVVLDANRPAGLAPLYDAPSSTPKFELVNTLSDAQSRPIYLLKVVEE